MVKALLQIVNVDFERLAGLLKGFRFPSPGSLGVVSGVLVHPGLFECYFLAVAVIVNRSELHQPNHHKVWEG